MSLIYSCHLQADSSTTSLIKQLKTAKHDTTKALILNKLSKEIISNDPVKALEYSFEALGIGNQYGRLDILLESLIHIGICNYYMGDYIEALQYYLEAVRLGKEVNNVESLANCYTNIGALYSDMGNYDKSLEYFMKALKLAEEQNKTQLLSRSYNNVGLIYYYTEQYKSSLECYMKSVEIKEELNDKFGLASTYNNMGEVYRIMQEYNQAVEFFNKSVNICNEIDDHRGTARAYSNIGLTHKHLENYSEAEKYFMLSLKIKEDQDNKKGLAQVYYNLGDVSLKQHKFDEALEYLNMSYKIARQIDSKVTLQNLYFTYSSLYEEKGDLAKAFDYQKMFISVKDSVLNLEKSEKITKFQIQFETLEKEKEIELLNKDNQLNEVILEQQSREISTRNTIIYVFIVFLVIIVIFAIILYFQVKQKNRANHELEMSNEEISQQKEEILSIAEKLELANEELEKQSIVARQSDNAVLILDSTGKFEWVNDCLLRKYGYTHKELIDSTDGNILNYSGHPDIKELFSNCIKNKESVIYESQANTRDDRVIWTQTTLTPIYEKDGSVSKLIAIDSDITKLKMAELEIQLQSDLLTKKNKQITDSIDYAKRIQEAMLPHGHLLHKYLPESFILYAPRDIVSGDFYWFTEQDEKIFFAAVDCTGHGVPGAFMSIIGTHLLDDIVVDKKIHDPAAILERLHIRTIRALSSSEKTINNEVILPDEQLSDDGMDLTICCIDKKNNTIEISTANHFTYIIQNDDIKTISGASFSIGERIKGKIVPSFTTTTIEIVPDTILYLFSDGYQDQFGGPKNRKFMASRFKRMLFDIHKLPMSEQKNVLYKEFMDWKGTLKQIDDVLVVGIKL